VGGRGDRGRGAEVVLSERWEGQGEGFGVGLVCAFVDGCEFGVGDCECYVIDFDGRILMQRLIRAPRHSDSLAMLL
jgi:hypothetical protein